MSIKIESLIKNFGDKVLFDSIDLEIPLNAVTVLTGPSGCGKTTLLRIMAGLDKDFQGKLTGMPQSMSFMFQEDRLLPWKNIKENIDFVLKDITDNKISDSAVKEIIEDVQLTGHEDKTPSMLSGGMKRRVAMARAYCYPAEIYLLDEPFKGFDAKLLEDMVSLFKGRFVDTSKTVILVTHDESLLAGMGLNKIDIGSFCRSTSLNSIDKITP